MEPWLVAVVIVAAVIVLLVATRREGRRLTARTPVQLEADRMQVRHEVFPEWLEHPDRIEPFLQRMDAATADEWRRKFRRYVYWRAEGREHVDAFLAAEHPVVDNELLFG